MHEGRARSTRLPESKGRASLPRLLRKVVSGCQRAAPHDQHVCTAHLLRELMGNWHIGGFDKAGGSRDRAPGVTGAIIVRANDETALGEISMVIVKYSIPQALLIRS